MAETIPPESKSQPASARDGDPHESVTIAPPAPHFDEMPRCAAVTPVPSHSSPSDQHFRAALDAGARAGSSLSDLSKLVAELSRGLSGAKQANEQLVQELGTLRATLGSANEQQWGLKHRLAQVEQELLASQANSERDRQYLTEQHDQFLVALLDEHEQALSNRGSDHDTTRMSSHVSDLAQQLLQADSARLQAERECAQARDARDEAQARADKRERERDELRAEASQLRARLGIHRRSSSTNPPPPVTSARPPSFRPPGTLQLDPGELDSTLLARGSTPRLPSVVPRFTPSPEPPGALQRPRTPSAVATASPSAAAFPRESTRPGVGGPMPSEPPPPPSFGPPPCGWTPPPPALEPSASPPARVVSAASLPVGVPSQAPILKRKPDPTTRPLIDYSLGKDGVQSETLEGARLSSNPPRK